MKSTTIKLLVIIALLAAGLVYKGCNENLMKKLITQHEQTITQMQHEATIKDSMLLVCGRQLKQATYNEVLVSSVTDGYKQLAEDWEIISQQYLELYLECLYQSNP